jgi:hypothetical protein
MRDSLKINKVQSGPPCFTGITKKVKARPGSVSKFVCLRQLEQFFFLTVK